VIGFQEKHMKTSRSLRFALPLVVFAAFSAGSASGADNNAGRVLLAQAPGKPKALSKEEIVKMSKAGIPDSVIIGKITKSGSVYKLEVADIIALKKAGVSDKVIEAMVNTENGVSAPTPKATPRAGATPKVPTEEEEILGVKPPEEGFEESGTWGGPVAGNMAQAASLYRDGKCEQATDMLFGLLEANKVPSKEVPNMQGRLADCLLKMGLRQSALYYYQDAVESGDAAAIAASLPKVIDLSDKLRDDRRLLGILDKINVGSIPSEVRRDASYFYGQLYFRKDDPETAKKALNSVPKDSRFYGRARYTLGVILSLEGNNDGAVAAFKEAIAAGDGASRTEKAAKDAEPDVISQQAQLAVARTLYAGEKYGQSVEAFRGVDRNGQVWAHSLFDNGWGLYKDKEYGYALGNVLSTRAPFFESFYEPEANILEAIVYYRLCLFPQASATINGFFQRYSPYSAKIKSFRKQAEKRPPEQVFAFLKDFVDSPRGKAASFMPSDLMLAVAEDGKISDILYHLHAVEAEQQRIRDIGPWRGSRVAAAIMDQMNGHKASMQKLGGRLVLREFEDQDEKLDNLFAQAKNIRFEITLGEKEALEESLLGKGTGAATNKQEDVAVVVPDDHYYWPFEGEYWKDEVGYYKFSVQGVCAK
jgi:tetratricopeptide (TPR) repeat protein